MSCKYLHWLQSTIRLGRGLALILSLCYRMWTCAAAAAGTREIAGDAFLGFTAAEAAASLRQTPFPVLQQAAAEAGAGAGAEAPAEVEAAAEAANVLFCQRNSF